MKPRLFRWLFPAPPPPPPPPPGEAHRLLCEDISIQVKNAISAADKGYIASARGLLSGAMGLLPKEENAAEVRAHQQRQQFATRLRTAEECLRHGMYAEARRQIGLAQTLLNDMEWQDI